jgi:hypothetical protein
LYLYSPAAAQEKARLPAVVKYEYRIVTMNEDGAGTAEKELNILGLEGYEIAFVTGTHESRAAKFGGFGKREPQQPVAATFEDSPVVYYTLKRVKQ